MTRSQTLAIRLSEIRQRLNEIAGLESDAMNDEVRAEADRLTSEYRNAETQHRSALVGEAEEQRAAEGEFGNADGTPAEVRALLSRVSLGDYLNPAAAGLGLAGAAVELAAALEVPTVGPKGGIAVPWRMLAGPAPEVRAFTTTDANDGPQMQRPILQRLFGPGIMDALGVRMDSVPAGRSEWPLITGGVAPDQAKEGAAAGAAVTAAFSYANLKPKRLTGRYEHTHEAAASVADLESALRRDLADAVASKMSDILINGTAPTTQNPQRIEGFLTKLTGTDLSNAEASAADYGRLHASGVDGIHAARETEVMSVVGDETYVHAAGVYITGSGESGSELLMRRSGGCLREHVHPGRVGHEAAGNPARERPERRGYARGFGGRNVADLGSDKGYLQPSLAGCRAHVGCALGCAYRIPGGGLQADRYSNRVDMEVERRAGGEVRVAGRTLSGVAMPYGTISPDFNERFEPGAFGEVMFVDLNLQHDHGVVVARGAALTDSPQALRVSATLPEGSAALALVRRRALNGYSIEFKSRVERREAGVRVVERAVLTGLALVDRGAYPGAVAEVRARGGRGGRLGTFRGGHPDQSQAVVPVFPGELCRGVVRGWRARRGSGQGRSSCRGRRLRERHCIEAAGRGPVLEGQGRVT